MELVMVGVLGIAGAVAVHLLSSELYDRVPGFAASLIRAAARQLPPPARERYREEWLAHMTECQGGLSKLLHGLECLICARNLSKIRKEFSVYFHIGDNLERVETDIETGIRIVEIIQNVLGRTRSDKSDGFETMATVRQKLVRRRREQTDGIPRPLRARQFFNAERRSRSSGEITIKIKVLPEA
jgi:hypothetical protein